MVAVGLDPGVAGSHHDRDVDRVPDGHVAGPDGLGRRQRARAQHLVHVPAVGGLDGGDAEAVLGQRAGLVGRDHGRLAEGLDCRQPPDDRSAPRHRGRALGERDRDDGAETLRHDGDCDRDADEERLLESLSVGEHGAREPDRQQDAGDGETAREVREPALKRGRGRLRLARELGDPPDLHREPGRDDDGACTSTGDRGSGEDERGALRERRLGGDRRRLLLDRHRLTRQRRLVDCERARCEEPGVGRHAVARAKQEQVAGDELLAPAG